MARFELSDAEWRINCFSSCPSGQMYRSFSASHSKSARVILHAIMRDRTDFKAA